MPICIFRKFSNSFTNKFTFLGASLWVSVGQGAGRRGVVMVKVDRGMCVCECVSAYLVRGGGGGVVRD